MMPLQERHLAALRVALDGRPVRWSSSQPGDYDGRERTLEVFNADAGEQRELFRRLRTVRAELERDAGGPVVVVFHTRNESARLYAEFVEQTLQVEAGRDVAAADTVAVEDCPPLATDIDVQHGARSIPRRAA